MDFKGLKITVAVLAAIFVACVVVAVVYDDDIDYRKAKNAGTKEAYADFISSHSRSEFCETAQKKIDSIEAEELKIRAENDYKSIIGNPNFEDLKLFLETYPDSDHVIQIRGMLDNFDDQFYEQLSSKYDASLASYYLSNLPEGKHVGEVNRLKVANEEDDVYRAALAQNTVVGYQYYIDTYPKGKHLNEMKTKLSSVQEQEAYDNAKRLSAEYAYRDYLTRFPKGKHRNEIKDLLDDLEAYDKYKNNSLAHGSQPYSAYYGRNRSCDYYGCSEICVQAPYNSDVVVIIKEDDSDGRVARHGYVGAGRKMCFEIPDGMYQVFFYYGKGWYPNKKMKSGVKGGFLRDEIFSKDYPQYLSGQILSYELILQSNGNFSTKPSNESEMF